MILQVRPYVLFSLLLVLPGCDTMRGVQRTVELGQSLPDRCVMSALGAIPKVKSIKYHRVEQGTSWLLYEGIRREPTIDQYVYQTQDGVAGVVEISQAEKGPIILKLYSEWLNYTPPKTLIDRARSVMDNVYENLQKECDHLPVSSLVKEECFGVDHDHCQPLSD